MIARVLFWYYANNAKVRFNGRQVLISTAGLDLDFLKRFVLKPENVFFSDAHVSTCMQQCNMESDRKAGIESAVTEFATAL